mmetsp:Transcript_122032/g.345875  ORF Transcript_122032/g.345875 Transcript_122032/m.345875 type:complete len:457 (-) Transcript_122032:63-1433(-)
MQAWPTLWAALAALPSTFASAASLPSLHAKEPLALLQQGANSTSWRVHVGDRVFYTPHAATPGLSRDISNYYYALGSHQALTDEMRERRVGGHGRWHIFHLPEGPSALQTMARGGERRSSFSALLQLQNGVVLPSSFPKYLADKKYRHPLSSHQQDAEKRAAKSITQEGVMGFLRDITSLPDPSQPIHTRSFTNPGASHAVQEYLHRQFASMGLNSCVHEFETMDGSKKLVNVVAHVPGRTTDSVTVGAHYDSRPFDGQAPGAEDNGSGVAAMLAVAKAFMQAKFAPVKSVYFVGFAAEEPGLLGSAFFAKDLASGSGLPPGCSTSQSFLQKSGRKSSHSAIVIDEVGWASKNFATPTVNLESYDWTKPVMDHLLQSSETHNGKTLDVIHNSRPFGSDHMSFLEHGMPAVLTINADDEQYPGYHQSTDTIDNVSPELVEKISRMILGATVRMAVSK